MAIPTKADQSRIKTATVEQLVSFVNQSCFPEFKVSADCDRTQLEVRAVDRLISISHSHGSSSQGRRPRLTDFVK